MVSSKLNAALLSFLQRSPTPFHAVDNLAAMLEENGFKYLNESEPWKISRDRGYFAIRNNSALIAFRPGLKDVLATGIRATGSHTDSPCLKLKPDPVFSNSGYTQLGVEVYGGALLRLGLIETFLSLGVLIFN